MITFYYASRHDTSSPTQPFQYSLDFSYADAPQTLAQDKFASSENPLLPRPRYTHATHFIDLPPFTRSHRMTMKTADISHGTDRLSIVASSLDKDVIVAAMDADVESTKKAAEDAGYETRYSWRSTGALDRPLSKEHVCVGVPRLGRWVYWDLWSSTVRNDGAWRENVVQISTATGGEWDAGREWERRDSLGEHVVGSRKEKDMDCWVAAMVKVRR